MKIIVLHVVTTDKISGAEKVVSDICTNINLDKFYPIVVCSGEELKGHFDSKNIECHIINLSKPNISGTLNLRNLIKKCSISIIHAHDVKASIASSIASENLKVPVISHIHSSYPWLVKNNTLKYIDMFFRNKYDLSIACSEKAAEYYLLNNKNANKSKIKVMGNRFNFKELNQVELLNKQVLKAQKGIDDNYYVFGYLGRLLESKGVDLIIETFNKFHSKYSNSIVAIVGDGDQRSYLEDLVDNYKLQDKVKFLGYQKDVYSYLNIFDSFILPSRFEGLPISLLEAMAMEKTIIATSTAGVPEVIMNNINGILLSERSNEKLFEAMEYVYLYPEKAKNLGKKAKEFLEKYRNIDQYILDLEEIYEEMIKK